MKHAKRFFSVFTPMAFAPLFFTSVAWVATLGGFNLLETMNNAIIPQVFCTFFGAFFGFLFAAIENKKQQ
jgi:hypothetical protein